MCCPYGYKLGEVPLPVHMARKFTVLTRRHYFSAEEKYKDFYPTYIPYDEKNLSVPLCGFDEYEDDIPDGTVVGVLLQDKSSSSFKYSVTASDALRDDVKLKPKSEQSLSGAEDEKIVYYDEKFYHEKVIYEHFFRTRSHPSNEHIYCLEPVYLDGKFVIRKEISHYFEVGISVPVAFLKSESFIIEKYFETHKEAAAQHGVDLKDYVSSVKISDFINLLNEFDGNTAQLAEKLSNKIPFKHYKNITDPLDGCGGPSAWLVGLDVPLYRFYEAVESHRQLLSEQIFTPEQMEAIGSWHLVKENYENILGAAQKSIGPEIEIYLSYRIKIHECLVEPVLDVSALKTISKKSEICRVFLPPSVCCVRKAKQVRNWSGVAISSGILGHIQAGNIVRLALGKVGDPDWWNKDYFVVLKRLPHGKLLVSHLNCYSDWDENILIVADVRSVLEIPLTWSGNENLEAILPSLTPPREEEESALSLSEQIGLFLTPNYHESIMEKDEILISFEDLIFESQK